MNNRELVYKSLKLIEENLQTDINVYSISEQFGFSLYYFSRLFRGVTGYALKQYILHRKITESYKDILNSDKKIIEIAFDYGFATPESFSRAFNRVVGINPSTLRKQSDFKTDALLQAITEEKIENRKKLDYLEPEFVELDSMQFVGIPFYFDIAEKNDLSEPWKNLTSNISLIHNRIRPEKYYQMQYWFADQDPSFFYFFIALEVDSIVEVPIQFTAKILPKQNYLKFLHKGLSNRVGYTYDYIYNRYLPESNYRLPHLFNFEHYGDTFIGPYNKESISEIYIPVEAK